MLRDFVLWWARQMLELLPRGLLLGADCMATLIVTVGRRHLTLSLRRRARETALGEDSTCKRPLRLSQCWSMIR
jgi:hypothetical protein